jgi:hypothetical protein
MYWVGDTPRSKEILKKTTHKLIMSLPLIILSFPEVSPAAIDEIGGDIIEFAPKLTR